ncbi:hypothetical protein [Flavobacterium sp. LB2P6]|uniref:hypothetical protein n=1 Tax=Flavobacterium sp. LB2P6 TaxID=3401714 RepID=UPI003AAB15FF
MKQLLLNLETQLATVTAIQYIDEDWGQLDDYGPHAPVKWPCCLVDFADADYTDIGTDRTATPQNRQQASGTITFNFANMKIGNSSKNAPINQKHQAYLMLEIIEEAHKKIHGFRPDENSGALIRKSFRRIKRDDGIQQYRVVYSIGLNNV